MNPNRERSKPEHNSHSQNSAQQKPSAGLSASPFDTLKCLTVCRGHISLSAAERQIQSLTQSALGLFNQRVFRECPFMLRQWREAFANCLLIVSQCRTREALWAGEERKRGAREKLCLSSRRFSHFPYVCAVFVWCELALLSVGTISLQAWRATDVAGLHCCFPPAPTIPPFIHRESNPIIWQDTQKHTTLALFKDKVPFIHPFANWSGMCR